MKNNQKWQAPGNTNPFSSKLENWHGDDVSKRTIGVLEFVNINNPTKKDFEKNIKPYLRDKYNLNENNSLASHFYRPIEFIGFIFWNDDKMYLSIDGKNFLKNIKENKYKKAYESYILQLLKTKYPNSATRNVKLNLYPYQIIFKLLLEKEKITKHDFKYKIPNISSFKDIKNYDNLAGSKPYEKILSWMVSYLLKWDILVIRNNYYRINLEQFPIIKDIISNIEFEEMFFEDNLFYKNNQLRKKYNRNHNLTKEVIKNYDYKCFFDSSHITFETDLMPNYLEGHHIIPMSFYDSFDFNLDIIKI